MQRVPAFLLVLFTMSPFYKVSAGSLDAWVDMNGEPQIGDLPQSLEQAVLPAELAEPSVKWSIWGVPRTIVALATPIYFGPLNASVVSDESTSQGLVAAFFMDHEMDFQILDRNRIELQITATDVGPLGWSVFRIQQAIDGIPVRHSDMVLHFDNDGALRFFHGNFYPDTVASGADYVYSYDEAKARVQTLLHEGEAVAGLRLEYLDPRIEDIGETSVVNALIPVWTAVTAGSVVRTILLDAVTGEVYQEDSAQQGAMQSNITFTPYEKTLSGITIQVPVIEARLQQIYNHWQSYGWTSYDNDDSVMQVYTDYCMCPGPQPYGCFSPDRQCGCYGGGYVPCPGLGKTEPYLGFWYGVTDAVNFPAQKEALNPQGYPQGAVVMIGNETLDLLAHEFGHGFNVHTAQLVYENESGAIAESFADCLGAMVDSSNWTLFEGSTYVSSYDNSVIRSLAEPWSTNLVPPGYMKDNPTCESLYVNYGHQSAHYVMKSSQPKDEDYGAIHVNSGIINKACHLLGDDSTPTHTYSGVTVEGQGRAVTSYIFHYAQRQFLTSTSNFSDTRSALLSAAFLYDIQQGDWLFAATNQTERAMDAVGVWSEQGNVGASLKNTTQRRVAAVEASTPSGNALFVFFRDDTYGRLRYLKKTSSGWQKLMLPTYVSMKNAAPTLASMYDTGYQFVDSTVFYLKSNNALARASIRNGVVYQPSSTENLGVQSTAEVGAISDTDYPCYIVAYRDTSTYNIMLRYLWVPTDPVNSFGVLLQEPVRVPVQGGWAPVPSWGGVSMARGDGRVWLAYTKRSGVGSPGPLCITSISDQELSPAYQGTRIWASPFCLVENTMIGCGNAHLPPMVFDSDIRAPSIFGYSPDGISQIRYYVAYYGDDFRLPDITARYPIMTSFMYDAANNTLEEHGLAVLLEQQTSSTYPVAGGFLKDLAGAFHFYYTDTDGYISELVKHGY